MNLRNILAAVVMMAGSVGGMGCASNVVSDAVDEVAQAAQADDASDAASYWGRGSYGRSYGRTSSWGRSSARVASRSYWGSRVGTRYYPNSYWARSAPPRARYEYIGRSPGAGYTWSNGYHAWNGRSYAWNGGRWQARRAGYTTYVQPAYSFLGGRFVFVPGYWR